VLGCGSYLPSRVVTNADLSGVVDTSDEWIVQRTGIRERRLAAEGEATSDMGIKAARAALAAAGVEPTAIDLVVLATSTPDNTFPASAVAIQAGLGITQGAAFDLQAVCSGFIFSLASADALLRSGAFKRALVIGSETFSRILDWTDRTTCVLFGDGAGAVVISDVIEEAFAATGYTAEDIDWFVPHQANKRIIDDSAQKLGISPEKVILTVEKHGNTSAASIPLALSVGVADGRIKRGDLVLLEAMGGGFTWGAALVRW